MPPRRFSRFTFSQRVRTASGNFILTEREKFRFRDLPDNKLHTVQQGETLQHIAYRYYQGISNGDPLFSPAELWWIIADFQLPPIHDPTIALVPGSTLIIPSKRTVLEKVFNRAER